MKLSVYLLFTVLIGVVMLASCAQDDTPRAYTVESEGSSISPFTRVTLANGLEVMVKEAHSAPIVAVYLWCKTGSVNEEDRVQGISHFYEHMFFKGTEKRGVGEIDRVVKSLGGYNNAFTSKEYTGYLVVLPSANFTLAADVLVDAIRNSLFPAEEIEKERGVINEEINRKEDDPTGALYEELFRVMFPGTPYAHEVLGSKETVANITREDFRNYLASHYVPNNLAAVVVGDVDTKTAVEEFRRLTADWKPDPAIESRKVSFEVPDFPGIHEVTLERDVNMTYVMMAFQSTGYQDERENAALDVLSSVMGEGHSSRLYRRIIEQEKIASSVQAFINPLTKAGMIMVMGTMAKENVPRFREVVLEEIQQLRAEPIAPDELRKVKTMLKADFQFSNETAADIAQTIGYYHTLGILDRATRYESTIDSVTAQDVQAFANAILTPESYTIGVLNQKPSPAAEVPGE